MIFYGYIWKILLKENLSRVLEKMLEIGAVEIDNVDLATIDCAFAKSLVFDFQDDNKLTSDIVELLMIYKGKKSYDELLTRIRANTSAMGDREYEPEVSIYRAFINILKRLKNLGLVETYKPQEDVLGSYCRLSNKGLEALLKLQEHKDNKKRFSQQRVISICALAVSIFALIGLSVNIWFSDKRLDESIKNTEINQKRLEHIEEKINDNKSEILEINIAQPVKVEIIKPVDVNILEPDPDSEPRATEPEC